MQETIAEVERALKESLSKFGVCLDQVLDIISQHERRIADLEGESGVKGELRKIQRRIEDLKDPAKREEAMSQFAILCHAFGIESLDVESLED